MRVGFGIRKPVEAEEVVVAVVRVLLERDLGLDVPSVGQLKGIFALEPVLSAELLRVSVFVAQVIRLALGIVGLAS